MKPTTFKLIWSRLNGIARHGKDGCLVAPSFIRSAATRDILTVCGALAGLFCVAGIGVTHAQSENPYSVIYDEPTRVNLGGRWVSADIKFVASRAVARTGTVRLGLVTDISKFIEESEQDLKNWVAANQEPCGERWSAGEPEISFPPSAIRFALDLELEVWNCGLRGKGKPGLLTKGAGRVDVTLDPSAWKLVRHLERNAIECSLDAFAA